MVLFFYLLYQAKEFYLMAITFLDLSSCSPRTLALQFSPLPPSSVLCSSSHTWNILKIPSLSPEHPPTASPFYSFHTHTSHTTCLHKPTQFFSPSFHALSRFHLYLLYWNCFFKATNGLLITKGGHINNPAWVAGITCATLLMSINHWLRATPRDVNSLELLVCLAPFKKAFRCWCLHLEACIKYAQRLSAESMGVSNNIWDSQASGQTWVIFWDEWIQTCFF